MGRRSKAKLFSPHSRNTGSTMLRRVCLAAVSIVLLLAVLLVAGYYQLLAYLQGDSFRLRANESVQKSLRAGQVELQSNLRINGNRVSVDGINLAHLASIEMAKVSGINAEVNRAALLGSKLHLHKLSMEDASFIINTGSHAKPKAGRTKSAKKARQRTTSRKASAPEPASEAFAFDSDAVQLDFLECRDTDIHLVHQGQTYRLLGANFTASPAPRTGTAAWQFSAENARFHSPFSFLGDCSVKSASFIRNTNSLDITECRIMLPPGEMRAKAHYDTRQHRWTADIQVNKGNLHRILNEDWKKRLHGELYGRMVLTGDAQGVGTASGNVSLQNGILEALPILSQIPLGNTYPYRSIELEKSDCQIIYPYHDAKAGESWLLDKINISAKGGILQVRGHILISNDEHLSGTLTVGIPEQVAESIPLARDVLVARLFTAQGPEEGYLWVNINLSGTLDNPQEDFSVRLSTLIGKQLGDTIAKGPASFMLDALLRRPAESPQQPQDEPANPASPVDAATEAAGTLLQSFF